jgi:hypothetical protein
VDTHASSYLRRHVHTNLHHFPLHRVRDLPLLQFPGFIITTMDASTAGSRKKKRDRAKERQGRREKQEKALHPDSDTSLDEDVPDNAPYGPHGEMKRR